jgi:hypothetical protein
MKTPHSSAASYRPYRNLPSLAGICSFEEAQRPGLSVEECVRRLKRYHYAFKRLHEIFLARLTAEPIYELKMAFSLHAHWCAEHVAALRQRVGEMREPPLGLDIVPDAALEIFFDEILCVPGTEGLLIGIYERAVRALVVALEEHLEDTNPLADAPTVRIVKFALTELREMAQYGARAIDAVLPVSPEDVDLPSAPEEGPLDSDWMNLLDRAMWAARGIAGTGGIQPGHLPGSPEEAELLKNWPATPPARKYSAKPFAYDPVPRRDERFPDPYNMAVNAEAFLYDPAQPPEPKVLMMFYKRIREIDVPEMMASLITETKGKPWGYYRDMTRQLWDEARHAMMGEVGFVSLGVDWHKVMVNFTWSLGLNTQLTAKERHGVLYFIEQGLMPKTGKRFEWETAQAAHNELSVLFQDYDWADEVLHARVGRDWYVSQFETPKEAVEWGDRAWSKVLIGWRQWRDEGLTEHRNWWPDVYGDYCRVKGVEPDASVLGFAESYETKRADLKVLSASG